MGIRSLGIYGLPLGLLLGGWIAEVAGTSMMIGVLGGLGLLGTVGAAIKWPVLLRGRSDSNDEIAGENE